MNSVEKDGPRSLLHELAVEFRKLLKETKEGKEVNDYGRKPR